MRSCQRQPWEDLRDEFLTLQKARKHPVLGPASAFRAAVSQEELARCSHLSGEFRRAVELYLAVPDDYAKSALADDALLAAARIQAENLGNKNAARALLDRQLKDYPTGDMKEKAVALRKELAPPTAVASLQKGLPAPRIEKTPARSPAPRDVRPEVQTLSWDSPGKNSVEIVLELSGPHHLWRAARQGQEKTLPTRCCSKLTTLPWSRTCAAASPCAAASFRPCACATARKGPTCSLNSATCAATTSAPCEIPSASCFPWPRATRPCRARPKGPPMPKAKPCRPRHKLVRAGRTNLVSQLGLSVGRVVIDAGHGGRDPGTQHNDLTERVITLDVAMTLGRLLEDNGLEVVYTPHQGRDPQPQQPYRKGQRGPGRHLRVHSHQRQPVGFGQRL